MSSLSRRCGGGPIFCHKTQTKRVALSGWKRLFDSDHRSCRRLFFGRNCRWLSLLYGPRAYLTWRETVLPDPPATPKKASPSPTEIRTRLFTCCLAGFMAQGLLGYLLQSVPLPARKHLGFAHSAQEITQGKYIYIFSLFKADFLCLCVEYIYVFTLGCFCFIFAVFPINPALFF